MGVAGAKGVCMSTGRRMRQQPGRAGASVTLKRGRAALSVVCFKRSSSRAMQYANVKRCTWDTQVWQQCQSPKQDGLG